MENGDYKRFLEGQFAEIKADLRGVRDDVVGLKTEMAGLKVKSGVWGAAMFAAAMIAFALFEFVIK